MEILDFLNGSGGMILIGGIVIVALLVKEYKKWRYFRSMDKRHKNKK